MATEQKSRKPRQRTCSICGADTAHSFLLCDPYLRVRTEEECKAAGVPFHIENPVILRNVATILLAHEREQTANR